MKIALIFNPFSGGKKSHRALPEVHRTLQRHDVNIDLFTSSYHGHLQLIAADLKIHKYDAIISMGGDGTHFHVLNGLLSKNKASDLPPLGIIPVGSGNSFVKDLEFRSVEDSLQAIITAKTRKIDVCSYSQADETYYFMNNIGLGFVTDVVYRSQSFKFYKNAAYLIGVVLQTIGLKFHHLKLKTESDSIEMENCLLAVCNSRYIGGNMLIDPIAEIDDGRFEIILVDPISRLELLKAFPLIYKGHHIDHPKVRLIQARSLRIQTDPVKHLSPEGEVDGQTPTQIAIHHKMLRYLC